MYLSIQLQSCQSVSINLLTYLLTYNNMQDEPGSGRNVTVRFYVMRLFKMTGCVMNWLL